MSQPEKQQDKTKEHDSNKALSEYRVVKVLLEIVLLILRITAALNK